MYRLVRLLAAGTFLGVASLFALCAGPAAAVSGIDPFALPPAPVQPPAIAGPAQQANTLFVSRGVWSNDPTSYSYQWQRCARDGLTCRDIKGATLPSYTLAKADIGHRVRAEEWAYNIGGVAGPQVSQPTAKVRSIVALALKNLVLSGIANRHPALRLLAVIGTGGSPLKSVTVLLPAGVTVSYAGARSAAVRIIGTRGPLRSTLIGRLDRMQIICRSRTFGISLRIGTPALALSHEFVTGVRERAVRAVQATLVVSDITGGRARFLVTVPVS